MKLSIYLFAGLSDLLKAAQLTILIDEPSITVKQLKDLLAAQHPHAAAAIEQAYVAKNQAYADLQESVSEEDELALIPPVSGGDGHAPKEATESSLEREFYAITTETISVERVTRKVIHPDHGASIVFVGTTREFTQGKRTVLLEYEAYAPMALRTMEQIGREIADRWPGTLTAITHRLGKVEISEISVVIAISSPHRGSCYEASRYAIERLKQIVPIWKKEIWEDGSEWKGHQQGPWNPSASLEGQDPPS